MPYTRRRHYRRKRKTVKSRFMPKQLQAKRFNQVSTKTFYFKTNGTILATAHPIQQTDFLTSQWITSPTLVPGISAAMSLWDEYKIMSMRVKWFPANVGIESYGIPPNLPFARGDAIVWSDQLTDTPIVPVSQITDKMGFGSCRMINARRPYSRILFRPKGSPLWNDTGNAGSTPPVPPTPDNWTGSISMAIQGANSTTLRPLWFYTITWKIVFRGRSNPGP